MHPAYSIIVFTTASGAGYGLLFAMALVALAGPLPANQGFAIAGFTAAFVLVSAGLLASTAHLGQPQRAWRAFSQWRSSWLSREGIAAMATYGIAAAFAYAWFMGGALAPFALASAAMCVVTVICTAMIYASLKPIRAWCNGWVAPVYLALGLMSGTLWLSALAVVAGVAAPGLGWLSLSAIATAWLLKLGYWRLVDAGGGETAEAATGLGNLGRVGLLDAPHTSENYLMKEMGYRLARKHAVKLRRLVVRAGFAAPFVLVVTALVLGPGLAAACAMVLAALFASAGVLVERWLFFAEARHTVMLYYGARTA